MVHRHTLGLVKGHEGALQELLCRVTWGGGLGVRGVLCEVGWGCQDWCAIGRQQHRCLKANQAATQGWSCVLPARELCSLLHMHHRHLTAGVDAAHSMQQQRCIHVQPPSSAPPQQHNWTGTHLVLLLEGQRKAVDDGPQDLQQLSNAIVALRLKNEPGNPGMQVVVL